MQIVENPQFLSALIILELITPPKRYMFLIKVTNWKIHNMQEIDLKNGVKEVGKGQIMWG